MGAFLFVFFFIVSISGILLGVKKDSAGLLLPVTQQGTSSNLKDWKDLAQLQLIAQTTLKDSVSEKFSKEIDRIDVRKGNGIAKFIFKDHSFEVQIDGTTGEILSIGRRTSDVIENIHDGSIIDSYLGTGGYIKLIYSTTMGIALFGFTITGFWLWYGPKKLRGTKR